MIHEFSYDSSSDYKRVQPFEYLDKDLDEYSFEYSRDILSDLSKFNAPIFTQRERRGIIFDDNILSLKRDRLSFVILDTEDNITRTTIRKPLIDKTFINNNTFIKRERISIPDMFKILFGTRYSCIGNYQGFISATQDIKKSYIADAYFGYKFIYGYIFEFYTAKEPNSILNIYKTIESASQTNILNVYKTISVDLTKLLSVYKNYNAQDSTGYLETTIFENYFMNNTKYIRNYSHVFLKEEPEKYFLSYFKRIYLKDKINVLNIYEDIIVTKLMVNTNIYKTISVKAPHRITNIKEDNFAKRIPEVLNGNIFKVVSVIHSDFIKKAYRFDILTVHRKLSTRRVVMSTGLKFFKKTLHKRFITNINWFGRKRSKAANFNKEKYAVKDLKINNYIDLVMQWGWKNHKFSELNKTEYVLYKDQKKLITKVYLELAKDRKKLVLENTNSRLVKDKKEFVYKDNSSFLLRENYSFVILRQPDFMYKDNKSMTINETETHLFKNVRDFVIQDGAVYLKKDKRNFEILVTETSVYRDSKSFCIDEHGNSLYRNRKSFVIENTNVSLERLVYLTRYDDTLSSLTILPYNLMLDNKSIGFIINAKDVQPLQNLTGLNKTLKDLFIDRTNVSLSKEIKPTALDNTDLWLFKAPVNTWVETHATMLTVLTKDIMLRHDELFIEKNKKDSIINLATSVYKKENTALFINKEQKYMYPHKGLFAYKAEKTLFYCENFFINKNLDEAFVTKVIDISKYHLHLAVFDTDFGINREVLELQVNEENIWYSRPRRGNMFKQFSVERHGNNCIYKNDLIADEKEIKIQLSDSIFIDRITYESNVVIQEFQRMQRLVKELEKPVTHTYNWAWVYEPDNPMEDTEHYKGLDELLLPEKDVDYSTFEKYIFNKDKMRPTNPIEIIDDSTFIAKYPIKHPTPNYEEVGIVYIDVPSELMYRIFCKYYEVWYANIFKFGNMSMVDSLRLMLDFMYSWIILEYTGTEYLEPALRVFRQIRWFGEKSVMHNAKYLISFDRTNLVCNLHNESLTEIENDITDNNFFYVNSTLGAIVNNSTYFNHEAYINLYMNYSVETMLKFNLSQAGGTTQVYLDSVFVDNIVNSSKAVVITIPPGSHNVKIYRSALDNFATCYIGGIVIANGSYTNLQITYDPELRLGNLPLNDVAQKMVNLASLYDNEQEAFKMYREGNLAVGELYKELQRYWELHHQGKIKGKRLTIKET